MRRHSDLLKWLQGEVQHYLPHEIMLAAWGDFGSNTIRYDIVSSLPGIRTAGLEPAGLLQLLRGLYKHWMEKGGTPCISGTEQTDHLHEYNGLQGSFGTAMKGMRSSLLHGISDKRGRHDCLYVFFRAEDELDSSMFGALNILLPYLDTALRGIEPVSYQPARGRFRADPEESDDNRLSNRESEIMDWVKMGKTNDEIATILCISSCTVKNHIQNVFKKLDVYNRLQAVSKIERRPIYC